MEAIKERVLSFVEIQKTLTIQSFLLSKDLIPAGLNTPMLIL
jgi:hypothetical protein